MSTEMKYAGHDVRAYVGFIRENLGAEEADWLAAQIDKQTAWAEQLDCVDNVRLACDLDDPSVRGYQYQEESGCCGSFDTYFVSPAGIRYSFGFNYGH
mgnify:CR=1 FL=1